VDERSALPRVVPSHHKDHQHADNQTADQTLRGTEPDADGDRIETRRVSPPKNGPVVFRHGDAQQKT